MKIYPVCKYCQNQAVGRVYPTYIFLPVTVDLGTNACEEHIARAMGLETLFGSHEGWKIVYYEDKPANSQ